MGTNYYGQISIHGEQTRLHIGKSSAGWKFLFAQYDNLTTMREWFAWLDRPGVTVTDEYGDEIAVDGLKNTVHAMQKEDNWDMENAPLRAWGPDHDRSRHERLDADGYRFSLSDPEDWS